jgi:hypothetical protein
LPIIQPKQIKPDSKGRVDKVFHHLDHTIHIGWTGSKGNANKVDDIGFDIGIGVKVAKEFYSDIKYLCLTHEHGDHIKVNALKALIKAMPWLKVVVHFRTYNNMNLKTLGYEDNFIVVKHNAEVRVDDNRIIKVREGEHGVPVIGFIIEQTVGDDIHHIIYSTDNRSYANFEDHDYDIMLTEGNYDEDALQLHRRKYDEVVNDSNFILNATTKEKAIMRGKLRKIWGSEYHCSKQVNQLFQVSHRKSRDSLCIVLHASETMY